MIFQYRSPFKIEKMINQDPSLPPEDPTVPHEELSAEEEIELSEEQIKQKIREERVIEWNIAEGDKTLRVDYPLLNSSSVVLDLGGYLGDWSSLIYCMYCPKIHIFEPIPIFYDTIKYRFKNNKNVFPHNYGLGKWSGNISIAYRDDATSIFTTGDTDNIEIKIMDIVEFLKSTSIQRIDLLKLNIEGAEYDVLERLIDTGWMSKIEHIQVQFHDFIDNAEGRRNNIRDHFAKTHEEKYNFEFIWEGWSRKR